MDILRRAMRLHQRTLERVAGEPVTYTDGLLVWEGRMVPGQSMFGDNAGEGDFHTDSKTADWLVNRESFVDSDGNEIEPRVGARITAESGDVFELVPAEGNSAYTWGDSRRTRYRIHTDKVSDA